jgi:hypothetical protein
VRDRRKPKLFVIDGKEHRSFPTAPVNVAAQRDFHRIEAEGYEPDTLEKGFSEFEGEVSQSLNRIIAARSIRDDNDRAYLLNLMALLAVKNPRHRENSRRTQEQIWKRALDLAAATPDMWASQIKFAALRRLEEAHPVVPGSSTYRGGERNPKRGVGFQFFRCLELLIRMPVAVSSAFRLGGTVETPIARSH